MLEQQKNHTRRRPPTTAVTHNIGKSELNVSATNVTQTTDLSVAGPSTSSRWGGVRRAFGGKKEPEVNELHKRLNDANVLQSIKKRSVSEGPGARYTTEGTGQSDGRERGAMPRISKFKQLARRAGNKEPSGG